MIDYDKALALDIPAVEYSYTDRDTMLYALGLGFGAAPLEENQLRYVYEKNLCAFPTMAVILAYQSLRDMGLGIDYSRMVHGEQTLVLHASLPVRGTVTGKARVTEIVDRGEKGAVVYMARDIRDKATGRLLASSGMSAFCRADGGFGGPVTATPAPHVIPERAPDMTCDIATFPQQALIYRLSGDVNPLHAEPGVAREAGFDRPILHGLATFGIVARALVASVLDHDASRLRSLGGRFSAPVFPGETLQVQIWREGDTASVRARVLERDTVVFNNGYALLSQDSAGQPN